MIWWDSCCSMERLMGLLLSWFMFLAASHGFPFRLRRGFDRRGSAFLDLGEARIFYCLPPYLLGECLEDGLGVEGLGCVDHEFVEASRVAVEVLGGPLHPLQPLLVDADCDLCHGRLAHRLYVCAVYLMGAVCGEGFILVGFVVFLYVLGCRRAHGEVAR